MEANSKQNSHTNGALATQQPLLSQPGPQFSPALLMGANFTEQLRPYVRSMVHAELGAMVREEIYAALTGQTAPAFPFTIPSATGRVTNAMKLCKEDGCPNRVRSKGLCSAHYQADRRAGQKDKKSTAAAKSARKRR